jgi:hypothetical protein
MSTSLAILRLDSILYQFNDTGCSYINCLVTTTIIWNFPARAGVTPDLTTPLFGRVHFLLPSCISVHLPYVFVHAFLTTVSYFVLQVSCVFSDFGSKPLFMVLCNLNLIEQDGMRVAVLTGGCILLIFIIPIHQRKSILIAHLRSTQPDLPTVLVSPHMNAFCRYRTWWQLWRGSHTDGR